MHISMHPFHTSKHAHSRKHAHAETHMHVLNRESGCNAHCLSAREACELLKQSLETSDHTQLCTQTLTKNTHMYCSSIGCTSWPFNTSETSLQVAGKAESVIIYGKNNAIHKTPGLKVGYQQVKSINKACMEAGAILRSDL